MRLPIPLSKDLRRSFRCDGDAQRCDAKRPCAPCVKLDGGCDCVYEWNLDPGGPVSSSDPNSSNFVQRESCPPGSDTSDESDPPTVQKKSNPEMQLVLFREGSPKSHQPATTSTFSLPSSLRPASIPRPLHTSLSLLSPEHLQVSDTTAPELDLSLYVFSSDVVPRHHGS